MYNEIEVIKMRKNPFIIGREFKEESFIDRQMELSRIENEIANANVLLYGPRRMGKTWLVEKVLLDLRKQYKIHSFSIDVSGFSTLESFVAKFVQILYSVVQSKLSISRFLRKYFPNSVSAFSVSFTPLVQLSIQLSKNKNIDVLSEALELPEKMAKDRKLVIAIDEFQAITSLGDDLDKIFRAHIQRQSNASYIFTGSEESLIRKFFLEKESSFYESVISLRLDDYLPLNDVSAFIKRQFQITGKTITEVALESLLNFTKGHPYFAQFVAREAWMRTTKVCNKATIVGVIDEAVERKSYEYDEKISKMKGIKKAALKIIADGYSIFSKDTLEEYNISAQEMNRTIRRLVDSGVVEKVSKGKYRFSDLFFEKYIGERIL